MSDQVRGVFDNDKVKKYATLFQGMITGNNEKFVRYWFELGINNVALNRLDILQHFCGLSSNSVSGNYHNSPLFVVLSLCW